MKHIANLTKGGISTALGIVILYLTIISPTSKVFLLGIATCIIIIMQLITDTKNSTLVYISTSILSLLAFGIRGSIISYILFFGCYGIIKYHIEKLRNIYFEIILKLVFFNTNMFISLFLYKKLFINLSPIKSSLTFAVIVLQFAFLIYDYVLTIFISYFNKRFLHKKFIK